MGGFNTVNGHDVIDRRITANEENPEVVDKQEGIKFDDLIATLDSKFQEDSQITKFALKNILKSVSNYARADNSMHFVFDKDHQKIFYATNVKEGSSIAIDFSFPISKLEKVFITAQQQKDVIHNNTADNVAMLHKAREERLERLNAESSPLAYLNLDQ